MDKLLSLLFWPLKLNLSKLTANISCKKRTFVKLLARSTSGLLEEVHTSHGRMEVRPPLPDSKYVHTAYHRAVLSAALRNGVAVLAWCCG